MLCRSIPQNVMRSHPVFLQCRAVNRRTPVPEYHSCNHSYRLPMDKLSSLLNRFSLRAGVFFSGNICGVHDFSKDALRGHLHLVRRGPVQLIGVRKRIVHIDRPTLLFLPRPEAHRLLADESAGADVVCGTVQFGGGGSNPVTDSLPDMVLVPLSALDGAEALLGLMFDEAFASRSGRQAALDRLCEVLLILLLRHCVDAGLTRGGALAGLADRRLSKVLIAVHDHPEKDWDLATMSGLAGMSRARFAVRFREVTGETPAGYVASWRVMTAQRMLREGMQIKHVAQDVGYGSGTALTRVFLRKLGISPTDWLKSAAGQDRHDERDARDDERDE